MKASELMISLSILLISESVVTIAMSFSLTVRSRQPSSLELIAIGNRLIETVIRMIVAHTRAAIVLQSFRFFFEIVPAESDPQEKHSLSEHLPRESFHMFKPDNDLGIVSL